jgi:hypothetical protein
VLQSTIEILIEIGRWYEMEMKRGGDLGDGNLKATIHNIDYDRPKTVGECGIFQLFG